MVERWRYAAAIGHDVLTLTPERVAMVTEGPPAEDAAARAFVEDDPRVKAG